MTYEEFTRLARRFHGQTLETKIGRRFTVEVDGGIVYFTPESTGVRRNTSRAVTEDLLERHSRTGSLRPSDYVDERRLVTVLFAAAYVEETGIAAYRATPGNQGAYLVSRLDGDSTEFVTVQLLGFGGLDPQIRRRRYRIGCLLPRG